MVKARSRKAAQPSTATREEDAANAESSSDGETAARDAQERTDERDARGGRRGPLNTSLQHFHPAKAVVEKNPLGQEELKWRFKCLHCAAYVCFLFFALVFDMNLTLKHPLFSPHAQSGSSC